jgi:two-component system, LytTR family, response regulator
MKKLSALIVDDEQHAIDGLKKLLNLYCPEVEVMATAHSIKDAVPLILSVKPDIAFLDVELQEGTGFDLAEVTTEAGSSLVFVTGHADYAQRAFTVDAIHYL